MVIFFLRSLEEEGEQCLLMTSITSRHKEYQYTDLLFFDKLFVDIWKKEIMK